MSDDRMRVSGWVFLLPPACPGRPGPKAVKRCVCVRCVRVFLLNICLGLTSSWMVWLSVDVYVMCDIVKNHVLSLVWVLSWGVLWFVLCDVHMSRTTMTRHSSTTIKLLSFLHQASSCRFSASDRCTYFVATTRMLVHSLRHHICIVLFMSLFLQHWRIHKVYCLLCFDTVGWVAGRASGL